MVVMGDVVSYVSSVGCVVCLMVLHVSTSLQKKHSDMSNELVEHNFCST